MLYPLSCPVSKTKTENLPQITLRFKFNELTLDFDDEILNFKNLNIVLKSSRVI